MPNSDAASHNNLARWWNTISHHPLWAALIATLLAAFIIARTGWLFTAAPGSTPTHPGAPLNRSSPLRISFVSTSPVNFAVAFNHSIPIPHPAERWAGLHARGGVDVNASDFRLTLANRSSKPLTVTSIEAEVERSRPAPTDSGAYVLTQGSEVLEQFDIELQSDAVGRAYPIRHEQDLHGRKALQLFFNHHSIALAPGAVYEANVEVISGIPKELDYAFIVAGNTATKGFRYLATPHFRIAGLALHYRHEYWLMPERTGRYCWVKAYTPHEGLPLCPDERYRGHEL